MNVRVLEAKRLLLGDDKLEIWLEECEDETWTIRFGRGVAERLHLSKRTGTGEGDSPAPAVRLGELLYKAELFDHMVSHLQGQLARDDSTDDTGSSRSADQLALLAQVGVCTQGLSDEALEAMAHEFMSQNYSEVTLDEIGAWARDVLAIRNERVDPIAPTPDLVRF